MAFPSILGDGDEAPELAAHRPNPAITPNDAKWQTVYQHFSDLVEGAEKTVEQILEENFTRHEAHIFVRNDRPDIKELQDSNTERYRSLLECRFKGIEQTIATKLTMMYFGLPVEPLNLSADRMDLDLDDSMSEGPDSMMNSPLSFPNVPKHQNWVGSSLPGASMETHKFTKSTLSSCKANEYPTSETIVNLRGGGSFDDDDDDGQEGSKKKSKGTEKPKRKEGKRSGEQHQGQPNPGTSFQSDATNEFSDSEDSRPLNRRDERELIELIDYRPPNEEPENLKDNWICLFGHRGALPIVPTKYRSFTKAVRKLLSLPLNMEHAEHDFSLVHFDLETMQRKDLVDKLPLRQVSRTMYHLQHHFQDRGKDHSKCCAFFVKLATEDTPHAWEPSSEQFRTNVTKIEFPIYSERDDPEQKFFNVAYIAFPEVKGQPFDITGFGANQYNVHFKTAIEVLLGLPQNGVTHHGVFSVYDANDPNSSQGRSGTNGAFGGIGAPMRVWEQLHPQNNSEARWMLDVTQIEGAEIPLVIPNHYPIPIQFPTLQYDDTTDLDGRGRSLVDEVWPREEKRDMQSLTLRIYPIVTRGAVPYPTELDVDVRPLDPTVAHIWESRGTGLFRASRKLFLLTLPSWTTAEYEPVLLPGWKFDGNGKVPKVNLPESICNLEVLREAVKDLCRQTHRKMYDEAVDGIFLKPVMRLDPDEQCGLDNVSFLIKPNATDQEWSRVRESIVHREVEVDIVSWKTKDWDEMIQKSNIWGPRLSQERILRRRPSTEFAKLPPVPLFPNLPPPTTRQSLGGPVQEERLLGEQPIAIELSEATQGVRDSEANWGQGTIYKGPIHPQFPSDEPPAEYMLRNSRNTPMTNTSALTPTEQARLEQFTRLQRNILLHRAMPCPYADCDYEYEVNDWDAIHRHLEETHRSIRCPWCNITIWEDWASEERNEHLREKHTGRLAEILVGRTSVQKLLEAVAKIRDPSRNQPSPTAGPAIEVQTERDESLQLLDGRQYLPADRGRPLRELSDPLEWYEEIGPVPDISSCEACPFQGCREPDLSAYNAHKVFLHFDILHADEHYRCAYCEFDFTSGWDGELEDFQMNRGPERDEDMIRHYECHVYKLWDRLNQIRTKCPFFSKCEAYIQDMDEEQLLEHLYKHHQLRKDKGKGLAKRRSGVGSYSNTVARRSTSGDESSMGGPGSIQRRSAVASGQAGSTRPQLRNRREAEDLRTPVPQARPSAVANQTESTPRTTRPSRRMPREVVTPADAPALSTRSSRPKSRVVETDLGTTEAEKTNESARGRAALRPAPESQPSQGGVHTTRRRSASPDWNEKLGPGDPDYEPDEGMYCSKCLRRTPKMRDRSPHRAGMARAVELAFHTDPTRSCRIRNEVGEASNVPNRSGWLPEKTVRRKLKEIKEKFKKQYPAYQYTLYPTNPMDFNQSVWRSDPNNDNNSNYWDIPWPPYEGPAPLPSGWEDPGPPIFETPSKKRPSRPRAERDVNYRPQPEEQETEEDAALQEAGRKKSPKRKRNATETEGSGSRQDDDTGPVAKKPRNRKNR